MRVLDLDLDFFLDKVLYGRGPDAARPDPSEANPWDESDVRGFLERRCRLSRSSRTPGRVFPNHDEVFRCWNRLTKDGLLPVPFHLVHVDAHSDVGIWGTIQENIMGRLLHVRPDRRIAELGKAVNAGNFLAYTPALRWLASVELVRHPYPMNDIPESSTSRAMTHRAGTSRCELTRLARYSGTTTRCPKARSSRFLWNRACHAPSATHTASVPWCHTTS